MSFFGKIWLFLFTFFSAAAKVVYENGGKVLTDAAMEAVKAAEKSGGKGEAKFAAALASVVAVLQAEGIPVVMNAVRIAVEAAVAKMNSSK